MSSPNFQCARCKRFHSDNLQGNTCDAYPEGIPNAIITNEHDHRESFPGDNGLKFKPRKEV